MAIRQQNFKKNPHTARWLMTFHTAAYGLPAELDENRAEYELAAGDGAPADLLDTVNVTEVVDRRTPAQIDFMEDLIADLTELDAEAGRKAREYTDGMTERGLWTPGRWDADTQTGGNASRWLSNLKAKIKLVKAQAPKVAPQPTTGGEVEIPANNYGIHHEGEVKCYQVDYGKEGTRWEGFLFLNRISSADRFPIKNRAEKERILAAIREDVEAAQILAGLTLRQCRRCHRPLSDTKNPYFSVALGPDCGAM